MRKAGDVPLHILLCAPAWPPGDANGIVTYCHYLHASLLAAGHRVSVLAPTGYEIDGLFHADPPARSPLDRLRDPHLRFSEDGRRWRTIRAGNRKLVAQIARLHRLHHFDVVEMEESFGRIAGLWRRELPPTVLRLHGPHWLTKPTVEDETQRRFSDRRSAAERHVIARARAVTSPSASLLAAMRLTARHRAVIPNPIALPVEGTCQAAGADPDHVLFAGRFDQLKGVDLAIQALARISARFPQARLTIAGPDRGMVEPGGQMLSANAYLAAQPPALRARINYVGTVPRDRLDALRRSAAVTIVPSRFETFSYAVAESMALGCPLVCANVGGMAELVTHGETGLLFGAGDADALAGELTAALSDPNAMARMAAAGRARAAHMLDPDRIAAETVAFYREVIADARD